LCRSLGTGISKCPEKLHAKLTQPLFTTVADDSYPPINFSEFFEFFRKKFQKPNEYKGVSNVAAAQKITVSEGRGPPPIPRNPEQEKQ